MLYTKQKFNLIIEVYQFDIWYNDIGQTVSNPLGLVFFNNFPTVLDFLAFLRHLNGFWKFFFLSASAAKALKKVLIYEFV